MITQITLIISVSIQIAVLAVLLTLSIKLIGESQKSITAVFLSFCFALWLFTDLYWLIYDLMRPETRMPFAVNEIGETAMSLICTEVVNSAVRRRARLPYGILFGIFLFVAANVELWILWSGEVFQDIVVGFVYMWLFFSLARSLISEQVLTKSEWIVLGILSFSVIVCQGLTFMVPEGIKNIPDLCAYILLLAGIVFFLYAFKRVCRADQPYAQMFLSFAIVIWIVIAKYMSGGYWYNLFLTLETIGCSLWYISVRKAVKAE